MKTRQPGRFRATARLLAGEVRTEFGLSGIFSAKERLDLRLEVVVGEGRGAFTDFAYWVDSFIE